MPEPSFRPLDQPVTIPLRALIEPWQPVPFDARTVTAAGAPLLLKGMVVRTTDPTTGTESLEALCLTCPHEICYVDLLVNTKNVEIDADWKPDHPLLVCPCHFSVFDPVADGARLAGPSSRGLFRFGFQVDGEAIVVDQIEEDIIGFFASHFDDK